MGYVFMVSNRTKCYGVWSDNSTVCSGHGTCMGPDECKCEHECTGHDCSVAYCFDIKFIALVSHPTCLIEFVQARASVYDTTSVSVNGFGGNKRQHKVTK